MPVIALSDNRDEFIREYLNGQIPGLKFILAPVCNTLKA